MTVQKKKFRVSALLFGVSIIIEFSPFKNSLFVRLVRLILVATSFYKTTKKIVVRRRRCLGGVHASPAHGTNGPTPTN